jgi:hypothetical protein
MTSDQARRDLAEHEAVIEVARVKAFKAMAFVLGSLAGAA